MGVLHEVNQSYTHVDGCNTCKCMEHGGACTRKFCLKKGVKCEILRFVYKDGLFRRELSPHVLMLMEMRNRWMRRGWIRMDVTNVFVASWVLSVQSNSDKLSTDVFVKLEQFQNVLWRAPNV